MVQRQAIQLYRSAVAAGFRNPCFSSRSFMALSTQALTPIQCSPLRISSLHVRSSSRVVSAPLSSSRTHFLSGSRVIPCKEFLRRVERDYFIWPRASLGSGRLFSVWRRDSDAKDDTIVAGARKSGGEESSSYESGNGAAEESSDDDDDGAEDGNGRSRIGAEDNRPQDARIVPMELHKEASESYLAYAMSVIVGRALPDCRDGLKPVHRRILYAMHELGLSSKKPFKKCARVVGEVLGKFHPHGDTAVYDALVRMAQDFSLRSPLVNGHGNFGSMDGDPAAAMRYTECRLQALSEAMLLADLELDTVDFIPTFDGSQDEPAVLPARLPNVLLNGASGIAVGMATNIPPHNLGEVVDALIALIHNPNASVEELMEHLPGPDFPTGGQILGTDGILEAYRTGHGRLTVRGKASIEQLDRRNSRSAVIITEVPYQANKAALVEKIADLVNNKTLEGVSDIRDESDRSGMRIVVEVKRGAMPKVVLNNLYKYTTLQSRFSCNMVGIIDGEPKVMGLKDFLETFLEFRCLIIERRAKFQLKRAEDRDHIVEGILIGLANLDGVVKVIRSAKDSAEASEELQKGFNVTHAQADALLAMPLRRLTSLESGKLKDEHNALTTEIADLKQLLNSKQRILQYIEKEALALKKEYGTPRRTLVEQGRDGEINDIDVIANEETIVTLSEKGYIKRMAAGTFTAQTRGTTGKSGGKMRSNDAMSDFFVCRTHDYVLFFSERGIVYSIRAYQIPECSRTSAGNPLIQIVPLPPGERITSVQPVSDFADDQSLVMLTTGGYIKRTALSSFAAIRSTGIVAIQLTPGDELKWVRNAAEEDTVALASQRGMVVCIGCNDDKLRARGRATRGVRAMRLRGNDKLAAMDIAPASLLHTKGNKPKAPWLLMVTEDGFGKRVPIKAFPKGVAGRVGVIGCKFHEGDLLASLFVVGANLSETDGESEEQVVVGSNNGIINRLRVRDISIQSRTAKGVKIMRIESGDKVSSVSVLTSADEEEGMEISESSELVSV